MHLIVHVVGTHAPQVVHVGCPKVLLALLLELHIIVFVKFIKIIVAVITSVLEVLR